MSNTFPGHRWMSELEKLCLLHPSAFNRQREWRYWLVSFSVIASWAAFNTRFFIGTVSPDLGLMVGNFASVHGDIGRSFSLISGIVCCMYPYFRLRLFLDSDVQFLTQLVDYDDHRKRTVLTGTFRTHFTKVMNKTIKGMVVWSKYCAANVMLSQFVIGVVTPLMVQGWSWSGLLFWMSWGVLGGMFYAGYYCGMDLIYIFGSWFLAKYHLDVQTDSLVNKMTEWSKTSSSVTVSDLINLDADLINLSKRVKRFDRISRDLVTPFRFEITLAAGVIIFIAHQQDNAAFAVMMDIMLGSLYGVSLFFLYMACSLSTRRKDMYVAANSLYVKVASTMRKNYSLRHLLIIRDVVKSCGNNHRPIIALTDKSGKEFDPMKFVEFVLETFSTFALVAKLYARYHK